MLYVKWNRTSYRDYGILQTQQGKQQQKDSVDYLTFSKYPRFIDMT